MRRAIGWLLGAAIAAGALAGCVVEPYHGHNHHHGGYDHPYDDDDFYAPPEHRHDHDRGDYQLPTLVCASKDGRPTRCRTDFRIERAAVDKRYSGSPCEYGRSWGYDSNEIWVDRGCRARFVLTPAGRWH
jgi:hypothetical protein